MSSIVDQRTSAANRVEDSAITAAELRGKGAPQTGSVACAYFQLLKPRVMTLVVFTAAVGLWLAPGEIEAWRVALGLLILAVGAGASGALNKHVRRLEPPGCLGKILSRHFAAGASGRSFKIPDKLFGAGNV